LQLVRIPEPSSLMLLAIACMCALSQARRMR
jgi:hypothetical protein